MVQSQFTVQDDIEMLNLLGQLRLSGSRRTKKEKHQRVIVIDPSILSPPYSRGHRVDGHVLARDALVQSLLQRESPSLLQLLLLLLLLVIGHSLLQQLSHGVVFRSNVVRGGVPENVLDKRVGAFE